MTRPRNIFVGALLAVVVVVVAISAGGSDSHEVSMVVPQATGLVGGYDIRQAGVVVGSIKSVDLTRDYKARLVLRIDDKVWPLPKDTIFRARTAGTIHYADRYIELDRGKAATNIGDGATLPASSYQDPVDFDTVFNTFGPQTRLDLSRTFAAMGKAAPSVERALPSGLRSGPAAAASAETIIRQLGDDPQALDTLVRSAAGVTRAVAGADPGLGALIETAGKTFRALASRTDKFETLLDEAPSTLAAARHTAARVDTTLNRAQALTTRLSPGVTQLQAVSAPLSHLLKTVTHIGPDARSTLRTLGGAAPQLSRFVTHAGDPLMPSVQSIGAQAATQLNCIRPYAPEIAGTAVNWAGLWGAVGDDTDQIFRAQVGFTEFPNETPVNSGPLSKLLPPGALGIAFPRPPGQIANQPWFQPQCGITADALNPDKDPESTNFDPLSKKLVDLDPAPVTGR